MKKLYFLALIALFNSCGPEENHIVDEKVMGYRPVYTDYASIRKIELLKARALTSPGKIYTKSKYLYINESGEGIHIFDNSDKTNPMPLAFLSIPVNKDISIRNDILYADNADDLVSIDISDFNNIRVLKRVEKAFPYPTYPNQRGKFECVDPSKGYVKVWEYVELINPKCYR